ncbi:MAG: hypothetical protein R6V54_08005 [Desulfobacteraceae bacterium]
MTAPFAMVQLAIPAEVKLDTSCHLFDFFGIACVSIPDFKYLDFQAQARSELLQLPLFQGSTGLIPVVLFSGNSLLKNPNVASQTPPGNLSWGQVPGETAVFLIERSVIHVRIKKGCQERSATFFKITTVPHQNMKAISRQ